MRRQSTAYPSPQCQLDGKTSLRLGNLLRAVNSRAHRIRAFGAWYPWIHGYPRPPAPTSMITCLEKKLLEQLALLGVHARLEANAHCSKGVDDDSSNHEGDLGTGA